ncbi:MAG TPA: heavy metal-associated domain-containing protein [Chloroflexota bacterium]|nr:heavy metal-associated domain-containing protein [Chloroflexota bacterium]
MEQASAHAHIVSHVPGRLRVRVRKGQRHPRVLHRIETQLAEQPGVRAVAVNAGTGSVMVQYNPRALSTESLLDLLHDVGVVAHSIFSDEEIDLSSADQTGAAGHSETAQSIIGALDRLDRRLSTLTGQKLDLKVLFPLGLGALGVRQLAVGGWGLAEIPAFVLLWYAFDSFYKLHRAPAVEPTASGFAPPDSPDAAVPVASPHD